MSRTAGPAIFGQPLHEELLPVALDDDDDFVRRLELTENRSTLAEQIEAGLKKFPDTRAGIAGGRLALLAAPFTDIVLRGFGDDPRRAESIRQQLGIRLGAHAEGFRVLMTAGTDEHHRWLEFGHGIFVPPSDGRNETPVARIELTGVDPEQSGGNGIVPAMPNGRPACWYEGQNGLAFGFSAHTVPATVKLDQLGGNFAGQLDNIVVCIGRASRSRAIRLSAFRQDGSARKRVVITLAGGGDVAGDRGRWLRLGLGLKGIGPLWIRLTDLSSFAPPESAEPKGPHLRVLGLALPDHGGLLSWRGTAATASRIDFDDKGSIRFSELNELTHTALRQSGNRFRVFDYRSLAWRRLLDTFTASKALGIADGRMVNEIELRQWPSKSLAKPLKNALRAYYGPAPRIVGLSNGNAMEPIPLGWVPLGPADGIARRLVATPRASDAAAGDISMDWSNRAAKVESLNWLGLAEFFAGRGTVTVKVTPDAAQDRRLHVNIFPAGGRGPAIQQLAPGQADLIGPVWAQFRPGS